MIGGPVRPSAGIRIRVLVIDADGSLDVFDTGSIGIHRQLGSRRQALVRRGALTCIADDNDDRIRVVDILPIGNHRHLIFLGVG